MLFQHFHVSHREVKFYGLKKLKGCIVVNGNILGRTSQSNYALIMADDDFINRAEIVEVFDKLEHILVFFVYVENTISVANIHYIFSNPKHIHFVLKVYL